MIAHEDCPKLAFGKRTFGRDCRPHMSGTITHMPGKLALRTCTSDRQGHIASSCMF